MLAKHKKITGIEETLKEKVSPLLEETIEKNLGVSFPQLESDITDQLMSAPFDMYIPEHLDFKQAKKHFKTEFLKRELQLHFGNISQVAKVLGMDRRTIHRAMKSLHIERSLLERNYDVRSYYRNLVDKTIRSTLDQYKEILHPIKMERMYEEVPRLSRSIVPFVQHKEVHWKEAEREFEKQFFQRRVQKHNGNVAQAAREIRIRPETLYRKIKKLSK